MRFNEKLITAMILTLAVALCTGCNGVILNPHYSNLLDRTAALSTVTADRAEAGELTEEEMVGTLRLQSKVWADFVKARDGEK